jgi:hypothetical protein
MTEPKEHPHPMINKIRKIGELRDLSALRNEIAEMAAELKQMPEKLKAEGNKKGALETILADISGP